MARIIRRTRLTGSLREVSNYVSNCLAPVNLANAYTLTRAREDLRRADAEQLLLHRVFLLDVTAGW